MHNCEQKPNAPAFFVKIPEYPIEIPVYERRYGEDIKRTDKPAFEHLRKYEIRRRRHRKKKIALSAIASLLVCIFVLFILVNYAPFLADHTFLKIFGFLDVTPPKIKVISPEEKMYYCEGKDALIPLIYVVNEPVSRTYYRLNGKGDLLTGNETLSLPPGRYNLTLTAYDMAANTGSVSISFTVTRIFNSLINLIDYLREDDLNTLEWRTDYTCHNFALDFIRRAESRGYYIFIYYGLWGEEERAFGDAVNSIRVVKYQGSWRYELRYEYPLISGVGHAVVKTTLNNMDLIIDPQTDIILRMDKEGGEISFIVLYEGEITEY